jgi:hypothetical protein
MNTTATYRNILFTERDIRLPARLPGRLRTQRHGAPAHDFLVLNPHPDLTADAPTLRPATAMLQEP